LENNKPYVPVGTVKFPDYGTILIEKNA